MRLYLKASIDGTGSPNIARNINIPQAMLTTFCLIPYFCREMDDSHFKLLFAYK